MNSTITRLPKSTRQLVWQLSTGKIQLNPLWKNKLYRGKFLLRGTLLYPQTFPWLNQLLQQPNVELFLLRQGNLPCKIHRPYLSTSFSYKAVRGALLFHYQFINQYIANQVTHQFFDSKPFTLATLIGKNEEQFTINIMSEDCYAREGELTVYLNSADYPSYLSCLTFSIINYENQPTLFIGGLQGPRAIVEHHSIQNTTKACHGLFPKRLLVEAVSSFAQQLGITQIAAVGNHSHVFNNWRYRRQRKNMVADYDNFWQSLEAKRDAKGHFLLTLPLNRKPIEEVVSKKRAEYKRRYQLLESLQQQIIQAQSSPVIDTIK